MSEIEVFNASQAAAFLGVHVQTIRKLAKSRQIPAFKVGTDWRFRKEALVDWADEQQLRGAENGQFSVLLVDDDEKVCRALSRMVTALGFMAREANSGADGLKSVAHEAPDLILLDLEMPDMNGPQFLDKLRELHPDVPVVIVTGYPDGELMKRAALHAPLLLLAKPVDRERLEQTVRTAVGAKAALAANGRNP